MMCFTFDPEEGSDAGTTTTFNASRTATVDGVVSSFELSEGELVFAGFGSTSSIEEAHGPELEGCRGEAL